MKISLHGLNKNEINLKIPDQVPKCNYLCHQMKDVELAVQMMLDAIDQIAFSKYL